LPITGSAPIGNVIETLLFPFYNTKKTNYLTFRLSLNLQIICLNSCNFFRIIFLLLLSIIPRSVVALLCFAPAQ